MVLGLLPPLCHRGSGFKSGPTCQGFDSFLFFFNWEAKLRSVVSRPEMEMLVHAFILKNPWIVYKWSKMLLLSFWPDHPKRSWFLFTGSPSNSEFNSRFSWSHLEPCTVRYLLTLETCPYIASRSLRSSDQGLLVVPWSRLKAKGDCAFEVVAPVVDTFKKQHTCVCMYALLHYLILLSILWRLCSWKVPYK